MALLLTQSWAFSTAIADMIANGELTTADTVTMSIQTGGPLGDNYLQVTNTNGSDFALRPLPSSVGTFFWGQRFFVYNNGADEAVYLVFVSPNGINQFVISFTTTTRVFKIYKGGYTGIYAPSALLATSGINAFPFAAWFYLEIGVVMSATSGTITIKVGAGPGNQSATVMTYTGQNAWDATPSTLVSAIAWLSTGGATGVFMRTMHEYLCDATGSSPNNTFLGDVRVVALEPVSNDSVAFTPVGESANWQNAALVPPVPASDYNSSSTLNAQDTYVVQDLPSNLGIVYGVTVVASMFKTDSGGRSMATVLKSSSTVQVNSNIAISTSPIATRSVSALDPATSSAWLASNMVGGKIKVGAKLTV
jgi:hypothetical protein